VPSKTTRLVLRSPCSTRFNAARTTRTGVAVSHDRIHIRMKPKTSANRARTTMAQANWVGVWFLSVREKTAASRTPSTGTPEPSALTIMMRPITPGANRRGGGPASRACAATGRRANSVNR
jgi:hypothetical protein